MKKIKEKIRKILANEIVDTFLTGFKWFAVVVIAIVLVILFVSYFPNFSLALMIIAFVVLISFMLGIAIKS